MAVSSSINFSQVFTELFEDARAELGVNADEEPVSAVELNKGMRACNRMFKAWQAEGVYSWTYTEGSKALTQGDYDLTVQSGGDITTVPMDLIDIRITRDSGTTYLPMTRMSRQEYFDLPNRATQGCPTQWYYDRQRDTGTLYLWPAPDATSSTIAYTYRRRLMDIDAGSNDFDIPQEWYEAVMFGLAARLIGHYAKAGTNEGIRVEREAARSYAIVKNYDTGEEESSIFITPEGWN